MIFSNEDRYSGESFYHTLTNTLVGRSIILLIVILVLLVIAYFTMPSKKKMLNRVVDDVAQCLAVNDSERGDELDDFIDNVYYAFTSADTIADKAEMNLFMEENKFHIYEHTFFSTAYIQSMTRTEQERCAVGFFGLVFPLVNYSDYRARFEDMRGDYGEKVLREAIIFAAEDFGSNPDLGDVFPDHGKKYDGHGPIETVSE